MVKSVFTWVKCILYVIAFIPGDIRYDQWQIPCLNNSNNWIGFRAGMCYNWNLQKCENFRWSRILCWILLRGALIRSLIASFKAVHIAFSKRQICPWFKIYRRRPPSSTMIWAMLGGNMEKGLSTSLECLASKVNIYIFNLHRYLADKLAVKWDEF